MKDTKKETKLVPKLRFMEFKGEWNPFQFKKLFSFARTNSHSRNDMANENGLIHNIHYGDIHTKYKTNFDISTEETPTINSNIDMNLQLDDYVKVGDMIIADASEDYKDIGKAIEIININDKKVVAGLHTILARPKTASNGFYGNLLKTFTVRKQLMRIANGISVLGISKTNLGEITLTIPNDEEQQKIASFLTAVDKRIELLTKKKKLLEEYKKGAMQKIFNQEIRFKDENGNDFPEWEEKKIGEMLKERSLYEVKDNGIEHVSLTKEGVVSKTDQYNRDFLVRTEDKKYKVTYRNDICYNPANLKFGVICRNTYGIGIFSPIYVTFEVTNSDSEFIELLVTSDIFINKARRFEEGTVYERQAVKPSDFVKTPVKIPALDEQKDIVKFISKLDSSISETYIMLEQSQRFKKSLLQEMFI